MATTTQSSTRLPLTQTIGSGSDALVLHLAQDYYLADAQVTITVDGKQVGGVVTLSSLMGSGSSDTLTVLGDWGAGAHSISVNFLNDACNKATGEDRNVTVLDISYNGTTIASKATTLFTTSSATFQFAQGATLNGTKNADTLVGTKYADVITGGAGADTLTGNGGHDIFVHGHGDGNDVITDFAATGTDSDVLRISGETIANFDQLKTHMIQSGSDTQIILSSTNIVTLKNVSKSALTAANFEFLNPLAINAGAALSAGTGSDTLVLKLTQDYFAGTNAQFTVSVDGKQVGGTFSASALRFTGASDTLTLKGAWGAGSHTVSVNFLNDSYSAADDLNLFVNSATINGTDITGATLSLTKTGAQQFGMTIAAAPVVVTAPTTSSSSSTTTSGTTSGSGTSSSGTTTTTTPVVVSHDVFDYAKGAGTKAITGFDAGSGADVLHIDGYSYANKVLGTGGLTSFADLKSHIAQVGSDTVISLSATDVITLKNVTASSLTADNFVVTSSLSGAYTYYTKNGWIAFDNTWNSGDLTYGRDYSVSSTYNPDNVNQGTTFNWTYPATPAVSWTKVLGYPSIMFGVDIYKNSNGESYDPAMSLPVKVADLTAMTSTFDFTMGGTTNGYDVSYDIWFTNTPQGIWSSVTNEVMVWLHKGDLNAWGDLVGTYNDGTYSAKIYHSGTYTALVPDKDYTAGQVDIASVIAKVKALGILSDNEYLDQIDFGAEPIKGTGSLTVNKLAYDITSTDATTGIVSTYHADGGVTTVTKTGTAKADVIDAGAAKIITMHGGAGNDTFVVNKGAAVSIDDFHVLTTTTAEHDVLKLVGYGTGATLVHDSGDAWSVHYTGGVDHLTLHNVSNLSTSDYIFV